MKKLILVLTVILLAFPLASQPCLDLGVKGDSPLRNCGLTVIGSMLQIT